MKIDLRKDKGILRASGFQASQSQESGLDQDQSEEERIAEVMRRRLSSAASKDDLATSDLAPIPNEETVEKKKSNRNPLREFVLLLLLLSVTLYYLYDKDLLQPYSNIVISYWTQIAGSEKQLEAQPVEIELEDDILSEDVFNSLMPVTEDLAALADSIQETPLAEVIKPASDTLFALDSSSEFTPVADEPNQLSDQDIVIINNRSLLLMMIELIGALPDDLGEAKVYLKRDALSITAPRGGKWVQTSKTLLDKFVFGSFDENYSSGNAHISSKFEIIMVAEQDFMAQNLDALRLLDVLAHPFNDYLEQIVVDLSRGINNNPASFSFSGTTREIQYVLSSWAESRCNMRIKSIDIQIKSSRLYVTLDVEFFDYQL